MAILKITDTRTITIYLQKPEVVAVKPVMDWDGFYTDYTWYRMPDGTHKFVFGDNDIYGPEDEADWECDSYEEAHDWFANYEGFNEEDDDSEEDDSEDDEDEEYEGIFGDLEDILDFLNIK